MCHFQKLFSFAKKYLKKNLRLESGQPDTLFKQFAVEIDEDNGDVGE